jgi:hypothetical protein
MPQHLQQTISLLTRTPAALDALLRDLPEAWTHRNEGEGTWTALDVIGHLIYCERVDWMPRVKMILQSGETRAFAPFDREGFVKQREDRSLGQSLDEFASLRSENLNALQALKLQPADLERRGRHPALGTVTLSQLLATWAAHDLTHLHQISRVMAHQYREAVGPWSQYLGVLKCAGHSSERFLASGQTRLRYSSQPIPPNHFLVIRRTQLRRPLLRLEIHIRDPEPLRIPIRPFVVIQQTPQKISLHRHTLAHRAV